jgi:hypothetical protein
VAAASGSTDFITELAMDWNQDKIIALAGYILSRCVLLRAEPY